jgi:hypothetical protein
VSKQVLLVTFPGKEGGENMFVTCYDLALVF